MNKIKLIIGLGNPGPEYRNTRHNTGFIFIDALEEKKWSKKFILEKSKDFMNKSGEAVLALSKFYKVKPENILIIHDDIDILFGKYKFSFGRSSAGHKGVESVIKALKTKNFWRLRIGIGRPGKKIKAEKIILKKLTKNELRELDGTIKKAISELETALL